ncbi:MAG: PAS domain-containing protein [Lachnospiraceae bacterium]|nr:PAS domain-containing protein [Lachnospiraceae bacterium]
MLLENKYLLKALNKSGYVILIKEYSKANKTRTLKYISPNAATIGMNVELLSKGMKLSEDYIFPGDREKVKKVIDDAINAKVKDYIHKYRMVGDDGQLYDVVNEVSITEGKDGNILLECYIRRKDNADKNERATDPISKKARDISNNEEEYKLLKQDEHLENAVNTFSKLSGLYCAYTDLDGRVLFAPSGPGAELGVFYDSFENPKYKQAYKELRDEVIESGESVIRKMISHPDGHLIASPIKNGSKVKGLWIVAAYTEEQNENLKKYYQDISSTAKFLSDYLGKKLSSEIEIAKSKGVGMKLREELDRQNIISTALSKINSNLYNSVNEVVEETLREVCEQLNLSEAFVYTRSKHNKNDYKIRSYWNITGESADQDLADTISTNIFIVEDSFKSNEGIYLVDNVNYTKETKLSIMRYNFKAIVGYPLFFRGKINGAAFFAEDRNERVFSSEELRFLKSISLVIQNMMESAFGDDNIRNVNKHLLETYNNFEVAVFVRDTHTGEVLFSNNKMNELMGRDFVGGDSHEIIHDLHDKFDNMTGMRTSFTQEKITNWRSFIQKFDQIMDITEIRMEWLDGEPASLIILRKANDL